MATSTITVPSREQIANYGPAAAAAIVDIATKALADITGLTAASLSSSTPAGLGTGAAGVAATASASDHVHPPASTGYSQIADGSAGATTAETLIFRVKNATTISAIKLCPTGAVTSNDTNYATITISKRDGLGGSGSSVAAVTTKTGGGGGTGNWSAFTTVDMGTITGGVLAAGTILTITVGKTSGGVQLPAFLVDFDFS